MVILARRSVLLAMLVTASSLHAGWLVEEQKLTASGGAADDNFGSSIAVSGNTAVVGASWDDEGGRGSGAAYIFVRSGATWSEQAKLIASDAADPEEDYFPEAHFGQSVAISGDTVVVGAFGGSSSIYSGSAYIFIRSGDTWSEQAKLTVSTPVAVTRSVSGEHDMFGDSVAISGDTVVVGAYQSNALAYHSGAAYCFTRTGTRWSQQTVLLASDIPEEYDFSYEFDSFGNSVAISGDTVVVGATGDDSWAFNSGAAYVFTRDGTDWGEPIKLPISDAAKLRKFGSSVAISGDTVVVGDVGDDHAGSGSGSAYIFDRNGVNWIEQAKLTAADAVEWDYFGGSVSVSGDTILVGAIGEDGVGGSESGSAYVFTRTGTHWNQQTKLVASDATAGDWFGNSVAVSGDTAMVSSSAYVFDLTCDTTYSLPSNQWRQISLPCDPGVNDTIAAVFGDDIPGTYGTDWMLHYYDTNGYIGFDEASATLSQGKAYWIIQKSGSDVILDMPENSTPTQVTHPTGCLASAKGCFEIPLVAQSNIAQWNMIGYPFASSGSLRNTRVLTDSGVCASGCDLNTAQSQGIVFSRLWTYNGATFTMVDTNDNFEPWMGYWVAALHNANGLNLRLFVPKP